MSFASVFGNYPMWFHILGQHNSLPPEQLLSPTARNYFRRVHGAGLKHLPALSLSFFAIFIWTSVCCFSKFFTDYSISQSFSLVLMTILGLFLTLFLFLILLAVAFNFVFSSDFDLLYMQINSIEQLARTRITWNLTDLRTYMSRLMFIVLAAHSLSYAEKFTKGQMTLNAMAMMYSVLIMRIFTMFTYFHILFYLQLLKYTLNLLVEYIEERITTKSITNVLMIAPCNADNNNMLTKSDFHMIKLIHFKLWEFAQTINRIFGWIMLVILIQYFLFAVYIVFHVCLILLNMFGFENLLRKSLSVGSMDKIKIYNNQFPSCHRIDL